MLMEYIDKASFIFSARALQREPDSCVFINTKLWTKCTTFATFSYARQYSKIVTFLVALSDALFLAC